MGPECAPLRAETRTAVLDRGSDLRAVAQILGLLAHFDMPRLAPGGAEAAHLLGEAGRLAFADRNAYVADPDFVSVPTRGLTDPGYLTVRAQASYGGAPAGRPVRDGCACVPAGPVLAEERIDGMTFRYPLVTELA